MGYAVFDTKADSIYKDEIENRYHFPGRYYDFAAPAVGSWIIYREPRDQGGTMEYFAVARLQRIEEDPEDATHYYAYVDCYTEFDRRVSWESEDGEYRERWLRELPRRQIGAQMRGKSIRLLESLDFEAIINLGLRGTFEEVVVDDQDLSVHDDPARTTTSFIRNVKVRRASFRRNVVRAYNDVCAFTGLRILDGNGNAEVEAAHIKGVAHDGPDISTNGIALSRTVHWLFDRYLISLTHDFGLTYEVDRLPDFIVKLLEPQKQCIILPADPKLHPARRFIEFHQKKYTELAERSG